MFCELKRGNVQSHLWSCRILSQIPRPLWGRFRPVTRTFCGDGTSVKQALLEEILAVRLRALTGSFWTTESLTAGTARVRNADFAVSQKEVPERLLRVDSGRDRRFSCGGRTRSILRIAR